MFLTSQAFVVHDDQEILIKDDEETGTRRRSFSDREGQKRELRGDLEEASYGGDRLSLYF